MGKPHTGNAKAPLWPGMWLHQHHGYLLVFACGQSRSQLNELQGPYKQIQAERAHRPLGTFVGNGKRAVAVAREAVPQVIG